MAEDLMRYDLLAQHALRGVVRLALKRVEREGLPGEHHFFIAFGTQEPDVGISDRLAKKYAEEMTIVVQHQFSGLKVLDDRFEIQLFFDGIPEKLSVPFAAIKGFFDPSVQFGLQFEVAENDSAVKADNESGDPAEGEHEAAPDNDAGEDAKPIDASNDDSKVVSLDTFRKK